MCRRTLSLAGFVSVIFLSCVWADVTVPTLFSDHAVLQREAAVPVWGTASVGEGVDGMSRHVCTTEDEIDCLRVEIQYGYEALASGQLRRARPETAAKGGQALGRIWRSVTIQRFSLPAGLRDVGATALAAESDHGGGRRSAGDSAVRELCLEGARSLVGRSVELGGAGADFQDRMSRIMDVGVAAWCRVS